MNKKRKKGKKERKKNERKKNGREERKIKKDYLIIF